jgi:hypothetical protein
MSRYIRNLAMAASAACVCGLLAAGAGQTSDHDPLLAYINGPR